MAADPARAGTAWLSTLGGFGSIFKTRDGGQHWQVILERGSVSALAVNPLRPGIVLAGQESTYSPEPALVRTDDGGTSWSPSDTGIAAQDVFKVLPDPSKPGALYAEGCCSLWKRTGAGQPFTPFVPAIPDPDDQYLILDPKTPSTLYVAASKGFGDSLYKSVDAGATWQQISDLSSINSPSIDSITIDPAHPSTLYSVNDDIFYRSDDGGFSWHALSGSVGREARLLTVTATAVYAYGVDDQPPYHKGLRRSTDGGTTWTTLLNFDSAAVEAVAEDQNDPRRLWTALAQYDTPEVTGGIYRSTDGGAHWSLSRVERRVFALAVDPRNSNRIWAASVGTVFLSEDGGATWVSFGEGLPAMEVFDLRLDPLDPDTLYAGTAGASVYELTRQAGE